MTFVDAIRNRLPIPLSPFGEAAVNAFSTLPNMVDWTLAADLQPIQAQEIIVKGWPLAILGANKGLNRILTKSKNGVINASDWSVVHAGALLTQLGARVDFPKEGKSRTPDIQAWWNEYPVDAEVKTAKIKDRQLELCRIMETLREVIGLDGTPWNPVIHLGEIPTSEVQSDIIEAVLRIEAGNRTGVAGKWDLLALPSDQGQMIVDAKSQHLIRPEWWLDDGPALSNTGVTISTKPENARRIFITAKLQFISYLNQVCEKANRPQRDESHPFLIVLDQGSEGAMPMRHERWQSELVDWFRIWPHVSGVLCFDQRPYILGKLCWKLSFHSNPHAIIPLPAPLLSLSPDDPEICVYPFA